MRVGDGVSSHSAEPVVNEDDANERTKRARARRRRSRAKRRQVLDRARARLETLHHRLLECEQAHPGTHGVSLEELPAWIAEIRAALSTWPASLDAPPDAHESTGDAVQEGLV